MNTSLFISFRMKPEKTTFAFVSVHETIYDVHVSRVSQNREKKAERRGPLCNWFHLICKPSSSCYILTMYVDKQHVITVNTSSAPEECTSVVITIFFRLITIIHKNTEGQWWLHLIIYPSVCSLVCLPHCWQSDVSLVKFILKFYELLFESVWIFTALDCFTFNFLKKVSCPDKSKISWKNLKNFGRIFYNHGKSLINCGRMAMNL